jgi:hypothetical protein
MKLTDAYRPLRVLDKAIKGGLGRGNIGVVVARHGTGKQAILTTLALDHALDGRNTLHVALNESISDVRAYDDEVFEEIAKSLGIPNRAEVLAEVERHKQIYTYRGGGFSLDKLSETLKFLAERAEFKPEMIEIQGWPDFREIAEEEMRQLKTIAIEHQCEIWCSSHIHREDERDESGLPRYLSRFLDHIEVVIALEPKDRRVHLQFLKTHDEKPPEGIRLVFDPSAMLIRWQ